MEEGSAAPRHIPRAEHPSRRRVLSTALPRIPRPNPLRRGEWGAGEREPAVLVSPGRGHLAKSGESSVPPAPIQYLLARPTDPRADPETQSTHSWEVTLEVGDFVPLLAPVWPASDPRPRTPKISWPKRAGGLGQGTLARGSAAPHLPWLLQHHLRASTSLWAFLGCAFQVGLSLYPTCPSLLFLEPQLSAGPRPKVTFSFPPCPAVRPAGIGPASVCSQGSVALTVHPSLRAASVSPAGREGQGQGPRSPPHSPVLRRLDSLRGR
ncbi:uncharacterized protein [Physeter macrocephalus]|uniref:Uncharacterized protein n=1 Tax=Physeter macrocephalus TaxID=9755 RepID=A0A455BGV1_PHYMC|nr:uncharacterized protein LOC114485607 [Physeter catodon]|eukprot:XP_028343186.1 uncharacterized protein LOC114485607 [Physeter catodon]